MFADLMVKAQTALMSMARREDGQGLVEYGLILALVAVLCIAALTTLQGGISNTLNSVTSSL